MTVFFVLGGTMKRPVSPSSVMDDDACEALVNTGGLASLATKMNPLFFFFFCGFLKIRSFYSRVHFPFLDVPLTLTFPADRFRKKKKVKMSFVRTLTSKAARGWWVCVGMSGLGNKKKLNTKTR